jgi:hypothetical protein
MGFLRKTTHIRGPEVILRTVTHCIFIGIKDVWNENYGEKENTFYIEYDFSVSRTVFEIIKQ